MDDKQRRSTALDRPQASSIPAGGIAEDDAKEAVRKYKAHQKAITQGLRKFFDTVASEPVPDEFMDLLRKMDSGRQDG
jgi:hypothetical protein